MNSVRFIFRPQGSFFDHPLMDTCYFIFHEDSEYVWKKNFGDPEVDRKHPTVYASKFFCLRFRPGAQSATFISTYRSWNLKSVCVLRNSASTSACTLFFSIVLTTVIIDFCISDLKSSSMLLWKVKLVEIESNEVFRSCACPYRTSVFEVIPKFQVSNSMKDDVRVPHLYWLRFDALLQGFILNWLRFVIRS